MRSTDHNLNNPLQVDTIKIFREKESAKYPGVIFTNQYMYDLIQTKDPFTIYKIIDADDGRMYYGDTLIPKDKVKTQYLIGQSNVYGEYILYMNKIEDYTDNLIIIAVFDNAQKAVNAMIRFNNIGNHSKIHMDLYEALLSYIDKELSMHDLLISILTIFDHREDPRLQELIELITSYDIGNIKSKNLDLPLSVKTRFSDLENHKDNSLCKLYIEYYNIICKYDFFKSDKFNTTRDKIDLSDPINDIINVLWKDFDKFTV